MMKAKRKSKGPVPDFKSHQEMAEFWDTHDTTDYAEHWTPVKVRFRGRS